MPVMPDDMVSESELSDTTMSVDGTIGGSARRRRSRRRVQRKSVMYFLGYPTPKILGKTKVIQKVLPRLLLQLQKMSEDGRSRPILEIFPSSRIAGPVIAPRLAKRFPGIFGVKRQLGYDDLVLVRRDDNDSILDGEGDGDEDLEKRRLVAVYSPLKHSDDAEIVLDDGSVWLARPLANGSYDFVSISAEGETTTARWARRSAQAASSCGASVDGGGAATKPAASVPDSRFTFSVINPLSRRHPVMATLTHSTLEVQDTYTSVSSSYGRYPPAIRTGGRPLSMTAVTSTQGALNGAASQRLSQGSTADYESDSGLPMTPAEPEYERTVHNIDDVTKMLIAVTAMWVALRSGWSPTYKSGNGHGYCHGEAQSPQVCSPRRASRRGSMSRPSAGGETPQLSETETVPELGVKKRYSLPLQPGTPGSYTPALTSPAPFTPRPIQRRATSTGAAFMQRRIMQTTSESEESPDRSGKRRSFSAPRVFGAKADSPPMSAATASFPPNKGPSTPPLPPTEAAYSPPKQGTTPATATPGLSSSINSSSNGGGNEKAHHVEGRGIRSRLTRWAHKFGVGGGGNGGGR